MIFKKKPQGKEKLANRYREVAREAYRAGQKKVALELMNKAKRIEQGAA